MKSLVSNPREDQMSKRFLTPLALLLYSSFRDIYPSNSLKTAALRITTLSSSHLDGDPLVHSAGGVQMRALA
jgi:hypothetical protein